jgi:hypothetical protein
MTEPHIVGVLPPLADMGFGDLTTERIDELFNELEPTGSTYSHLPEPPFPINEIAYWIYRTEMTSPHRDVAILTAWLLCSAFAGRKDSFLGNPPVMVVTMLALNGVGKDTIKRTLLKITNQLYSRHRDAGDDQHKNVARFDGVDPAHGTVKMCETELDILSGLRITSEAGLNGQSTSGDGPKVRAALLQNVAQGAYSRRSYHSAASKAGNLRPFGVCVSVLDESTPETYNQNTGGALGTGQAARTLMVRMDASKVGDTNYLDGGKPVPEEILNYFERLFQEAMREEDSTLADGISSDPVATKARKTFTYSPGVGDRVVELGVLDTAHRRANTENEASLEWAQFVRGPQLIFRMALIAARTRALISNNTAMVTKVDMDAAEDFVAECRRTERANASDYEDNYSQAAGALKVWGLKQLASTTPSATWKKHAKPDDKKRGEVRYAVAYTNSGNTKARQLVSSIATDINRSPKEAYKAVADVGQALGYWDVDQELTLKFK